MFKSVGFLLLLLTLTSASDLLIGGAVGYALGSSGKQSPVIADKDIQASSDSVTDVCFITLNRFGHTIYDMSCGKVRYQVVDKPSYGFFPEQTHDVWCTVDEYLLKIFPKKKIASYQLVLKEGATYDVLVIVRIRKN